MTFAFEELSKLGLFAFLASVAMVSGCDADEDEGMPLACRAQSYRYSEYTGGSRSCHCHDTEFVVDRDEPQAVCNALYDDLFSASYSSGSHSREFSFVTPGPGLTCDEIDVQTCDNTEI